MVRIWLVGTSGSGKSTLARAIQARTSAKWIQLDAVYHQPNWTALPTAEFREIMAEVVDEESWVVDGNYIETIGDLVAARADILVLLDLPKRSVMRQVIWRTARRMITGEELWNGNRERPRDVFCLDKDRSIVVWAWVTHGQSGKRIAKLWANLEHPAPRVVRLRSRRQINQFLAELPGR
jgi:adenylate kinase family enzyme